MYSLNKGFTLVELLVSLALASLGAALALSLWFQFFATLLDRQKNTQAFIGREFAFLGLESRIRKNCGMVLMAPERLEWNNCKGSVDRLWVEGSQIFLNDAPILKELNGGLRIEVLGAQYPVESLDSVWLPWKKIDSNRDGVLQFEELDQDYSKTLEEAEMGNAALLIVHLAAPRSPVSQIRLHLR